MFEFCAGIASRARRESLPGKLTQKKRELDEMGGVRLLRDPHEDRDYPFDPIMATPAERTDQEKWNPVSDYLG